MSLGFINHLRGKWVDGQVSLAYFLSGKRPSTPHAQISDASCLQKGCHKIDDLKGDMVYKNVAFSHRKHLGELRRGMNSGVPVVTPSLFKGNTLLFMKPTVSSVTITRLVQRERRSAFRVRSVGVLLAISPQREILKLMGGVSIIRNILQEGWPV